MGKRLASHDACIVDQELCGEVVGAGKTAVEAPPSGNPGKKAVYLCGDCAALVNYAMDKRRKCPLDPKPSCKHCPIHCYGKAYRTKMREVMAFSGKRLILRGRLDLLWHYFF